MFSSVKQYCIYSLRLEHFISTSPSIVQIYDYFFNKYETAENFIF